MGGWGEERDVSLAAGEAVAAALEARGHHVTRLEVGPGLDLALRAAAVDVAFLALRGRVAEDGRVQGLLEVLGIPYTGSGVLASALARHKGTAKKLFRQHNLATPAGYVVGLADLDRVEELHCDLGFPCVVKPATGASSVGLSLVESREALPTAVAEACRYGGEALVERYVKGREVTVAVLDGQVLGSVEVGPGAAADDCAGRDDAPSRVHCPPRLSPTRLANLEALALSAWRALGCRGVACFDFLCPDVGNEVLLEANALPALTPTSRLGRIARARGLGFEALCERLLGLAARDALDVLPRPEVPRRAAPARQVG